MYKRAPIEILRKLTKKEMNGLLAFLNNPEHNKRKDTIELAKYFSTFYPKLNSSNLRKDIVITKIFNLSNANQVEDFEIKFNHLFSDFSKKLKIYCAFLHLKKDEQAINHHYQKFLDDKGIGELNFNSLKKGIGKNKPKNTWERIEHLKNVNHFYYNPLFSKYDSINATEIIQFLIHEPEIISIQLQLKYLCELIMRNSITQDHVYVDDTMYIVLEKVRKFENEIDLESRCYYLFLESTIDPGMIEAFENATIDYFDSFPKSNDSKILYVMMLNFYISKIHVSETRDVIETAFDWYLLGIKYDFIIDVKKIQVSHFINLIGLAIEVDQVEKLHNTLNKKYGEEESLLSHIDNFANKENEKPIEEVKTICQTYIDFDNKNFENCRSIYGKIFKHPNFALLAYRLMIKANMEIWLQSNTDFSVLKSSIDAFKKYLHRNTSRLSETHSTLNKQFIKYLNLILKNNEKSVLETIKIEISSTPKIAAKWWLVDKIEILKEMEMNINA